MRLNSIFPQEKPPILWYLFSYAIYILDIMFQTGRLIKLLYVDCVDGLEV